MTKVQQVVKEAIQFVGMVLVLLAAVYGLGVGTKMGIRAYLAPARVDRLEVRVKALEDSMWAAGRRLESLGADLDDLLVEVRER